jgi:thioredoxin reductase (NADPH)
VLAIGLADGRRLQARCIVVASGARYRRPEVQRLGEFEGRGVWYWASAIEARMCAQTDVALVGGGNSAGQAAVFLAQHAARVVMLVRGAGLAASMSRYLIDRIEATPNIELKAHTELTHLHGDATGGLAAATWRDRRGGVEEQRLLSNLFLFVGADPETAWLQGCGVAVDGHGFVLTGPATGRHADGRMPTALEGSVPGVFAVGDVRSGSVKRVGAAIGEGAAAVAQIHALLAASPQTQ